MNGNGVTHISGRLPDPHKIVADLDHRAKAAAAAAGADSLAVVQSSGAPGSFAGASMESKVAKTSTGYSVTVGAVKKRRHILRWVTQGTGIYGPLKKQIRPRKAKAMKFNGGEHDTVRGQKPQPFLERNRARATEAAVRAITNAGLRGR